MDGIIYPSRLNNEARLAIDDRAMPRIGPVLDRFQVAFPDALSLPPTGHP